MREKWEEEEKSGRPPTFSILSPVQPPLGLMFDILIIAYQKIIVKQSKNENSNTKDKGFTSSFNVLFSTQKTAN